MKFKVGDKVRLVSMKDESACYKKYLGKIFTVKKVYSNFVIFEEYTEEHIGPYLKNLEKIEYTYEDLKESPIGTKITFEKGRVLIKAYNKEFTDIAGSRNINDLKNLQDNWSRGYYGKIIKIEEPTYGTVYEHKPEILDEAEKRYLRGVIRPFKDKVKSITKEQETRDDGEDKSFIGISVDDDVDILLPYFDTGTMYNGMKVSKRYTLEELGL